MAREQQHLDAVRRSNFYFFVIEAFRVLHPGTALSLEHVPGRRRHHR